MREELENQKIIERYTGRDDRLTYRSTTYVITNQNTANVADGVEEDECVWLGGGGAGAEEEGREW